MMAAGPTGADSIVSAPVDPALRRRGLADCDAALSWLVDHDDELGVQPDFDHRRQQPRGGSHAVDAQGGPAFQLLEAPTLDLATTSRQIRVTTNGTAKKTTVRSPWTLTPKHGRRRGKPFGDLLTGS